MKTLGKLLLSILTAALALYAGAISAVTAWASVQSVGEGSWGWALEFLVFATVSGIIAGLLGRFVLGLWRPVQPSMVLRWPWLDGVMGSMSSSTMGEVARALFAHACAQTWFSAAFVAAGFLAGMIWMAASAIDSLQGSRAVAEAPEITVAQAPRHAGTGGPVLLRGFASVVEGEELTTPTARPLVFQYVEISRLESVLFGSTKERVVFRSSAPRRFAIRDGEAHVYVYGHSLHTRYIPWRATNRADVAAEHGAPTSVGDKVKVHEILHNDPVVGFGTIVEDPKGVYALWPSRGSEGIYAVAPSADHIIDSLRRGLWASIALLVVVSGVFAGSAACARSRFRTDRKVASAPPAVAACPAEPPTSA